MNKKIAIIVGVLILIVAGIYLYSKREVQAPVQTNNQPETSEDVQTQNSPTPTPAPAQAPAPSPAGGTTPTPPPAKVSEGTFSSGEEMSGGPDIQVVEVVYDGSKYTPSSVNIKVNDWIFFKNSSSGDFWPASAPHPSHTNYPEFDAKKPVAAGQTWKFQFTKAGTWGFHDHLNPTVRGSITVK